MKKFYVLLVLSLVIFSCSSDDEMDDVLMKKDALKSDEVQTVAVCHKGNKTLLVELADLQDHLDHGDKLGPCDDLDYTYVPDDNFEQALIEWGYDDVMDNLVETANISGIEKLDVRSREIADLTGIEDFLSLKDLNCNNNYLKVLNLSNNLELKQLNFINNLLLELNVTNCSKLELIYGSDNRLANIDLSSNINITRLSMQSNELTALDVSKNLKLEILNIENNFIMELDLSLNNMLARITCFNNGMEFLNVKNGANELIKVWNSRANPGLSCIQVDDAEYSTLNWTKRHPNSEFSENCGS